MTDPLKNLAATLLLLCTFVFGAAAQGHVSLRTDTQEEILGVYLPKIAVAADGSYALAAEALVRSDTGREVRKVIVQRYAASGTPVGPAHLFAGESCSQFSIWLADYLERPEIAFQPDGTLIVLMQHSGEYQLLGDGIQSAEMTLGAIDPAGQLIDLRPDNGACIQSSLIFPSGKRQDRPRLALTPAGDIFATADGFFDDAAFRNVAIRVLDAAGNEVIEQVIPHADPLSQQAYHMEPDVATNGGILLSTWYECPFIDDQGKEAVNFQITMTLAAIDVACPQRLGNR